MSIHDLYRSSIGSQNASSPGVRETLSPEQAYYAPEVLMTGQVCVNSGREARPLLPQSPAPPRITASALDAQELAERVAQRARHVASLESVYIKGRPWGFECWLISNHSTEDERFCLYDLEWQLMELVHDVGFKFHLIDRHGQPLEQVLTLEPPDAIVGLRKKRDA